jgi:hypothetical protein
LPCWSSACHKIIFMTWMEIAVIMTE